MAISSPSDEFNYYSTLLELKRPDGSFLFEQVRIGLACKTCMDNGEAAACTHMTHIIPHWLSVARSELAKLLYQADEASYIREVKGGIASDYCYVFDKQLIQSFSRRQPYVFTDPNRVRTIYVGVDPSGGGSASKFAIVSITYVHGRKVVSAAKKKAATNSMQADA